MQVQKETPKTSRSEGPIRGSVFMLLITMMFVVPALGQRLGIGWPRTIQSNNDIIQVYQPQVEKWENGKIEAREAVVISRRNVGQPVYGVVWFSARAVLDQDARLATLYDIEVKKAEFPSASGEESSYVQSATQALSKWTFTIGIDRLLADLAITQAEEKSKGENLSATPPRIYVRQTPAVLILIDGQPVMKNVSGTTLMRVINSPAVIVFEPGTASYFLQGDGYWMTAPNLNGPWQKAVSPPKAVADVLQQEEPSPTAAAATAKAAEAPPEVIVSNEPAELVELRGEPQFSPIDGTKLLYVTNTDGDLFMSVPDQRFYLLLSGRWFSAPKLDGQWSFVPGANLPADFAHIPPGDPKGTVLASVPGTLQARDAIVAAEVPQTATVDRKQAQFTATYDGPPQFKPIEGTDMSYATNSPNDVILVSGKYYAVSDGVWFVADSPLGPWVVCDSVPPQIYSIPPTAPVYPVRYVYVYDSTPDYVYVGYTPGYFGAYVWDGVVVYGTGFWYPCWAFDFWYGCPWTWGFGWHYVYWGWGFHWRPWHRHPWYWHTWRTAGWGDGRWNRRVLYNRSVERAAGRTSLANSTVYDRWKSPAVVSRHPVSLRPPGIGKEPRVVPGRPIPGRPDLYAGHDGAVYQHRNDGWYRRDGETWQKLGPEAPRPEAAAPRTPQQPARPGVTQRPPRETLQELDRQREARAQGQARVRQYQTMRPPAAPRPPAGRPGRPH
jgi:hypothetical protein